MEAQAQILVDACAARDVERLSAALGRDAQADRVAAVGPEIGLRRGGILEIERHFPGDGEAFDPHARLLAVRVANFQLIPQGQSAPGHDRVIEDIENGVRVKHRQDLHRCIDGEGLSLAQAQKAGDMVDIGIGEHHGPDGRRAQRRVRAGLQFGRPADLLANVGRGVEHDPAVPVGGGGKARLRPFAPPLPRGPRGSADRCSSIAENRRRPPIRSPSGAWRCPFRHTPVSRYHTRPERLGGFVVVPEHPGSVGGRRCAPLHRQGARIRSAYFLGGTSAGR